MVYKEHKQKVTVAGRTVVVFNDSQHNAVILGAAKIGYSRSHIVDIRKKAPGQYQLLLITGEWLPVEVVQTKEFRTNRR